MENNMEKLSDLTIDEFLEKLSICKFPGPAAGSAVGTIQAITAALMKMACCCTLKKDPENSICKASIEVAEALQADALIQSEADILAYMEVIRAGKSNEPQSYQQAMEGAIGPFTNLLDNCYQLLIEVQKILQDSYSLVLGDLVICASLAEAVAAAAKAGIDINSMSLTDQNVKQKILKNASERYQLCLGLKEAILAQALAPESASQVIDESQKVLEFWFDPENKPYWFQKNESFDQNLRDQFYVLWQAACKGELSLWRQTIRGRLAEIILLDQFSRNFNRNGEMAFSQDSMALVLAQEALRQPEFKSLLQSEKQFILMPFMHSESAAIHEQALSYFEELNDSETLEYEIKHKAIIDQFGRYPHRNDILGRVSTSEEIEFLKQPGSSF
ncbi:DUF924 family protein [Eubacteriaceae bacterium ES3]|nr:DUF924 family protein [Eubacteriaceae bacterium ES3]